MGHSKNRKKRRLGRIHKQALFTEPMLPYCEFKTRCDTRFSEWCGFEKWFDAAETATFDLYEERDHKELAIEFILCSDGNRELIFPSQTEYGFLRRLAIDLKTYLEFDDSGIKGKFYHTKKAKYYRKKGIKEFIEWFRSLVEEKYKEVQETEPDKIEPWIVELMNRKD